LSIGVVGIKFKDFSFCVIGWVLMWVSMVWEIR